jgi:nicotinamide mononucleotide adenylyltransferase
MAGLSFLYEEYRKDPERVEKLLSGTIEISEKLDGSRFFMQNDGGGKLSFFKRKDVPISKIDRTLSKYYEKAINHFSNFSEEKISDIPEGWRFGMEYFPNLQPVTIAYDRLPLNNLVLTDIQVRDPRDKILEVISDKETLDEWARILEVEAPPVYFEGTLDETQKRRILDFLNSPQDSLVKRFQTENFTRFILELLNPELTKSFLHSDNTKEIDGLIFKFDGKEAYRFSNPEVVMKKTQKREESPSDIYNLTLVILQEFLTSIDFKKIHLKEKSFEERYIEFISKVFNLFVKSPQYKNNFEKGVDFELPKFLTREESGVNFGFVKDPETLDLLRKNGTNRELFKILLASMRTHKRKASKFFTKSLIFHHNKLVDDIADYINSNLKESFFTFQEFKNVFLNENASWQEEFGKESFEEVEDFGKFPMFTDVMKPEKQISPIQIFSRMMRTEEDVPKKKSTPVCMMKGKFFPFHNGHATSVEDAASSSGMKIFLIVVRKKSKFPEKLHAQLMDEIVKSNDKIVGYIFSDGLTYPEITRDVPSKYEVKAFAGSEKECNDYAKQGGSAQTVVIEKHLSSKKVLQKIQEEDIENFRKLVPKSLHNYFHKIKNEVLIE